MPSHIFVPPTTNTPPKSSRIELKLLKYTLYIGFHSAARTCKNENKFISEKPCGEEKLTYSEIDMGFLDCRWSVKGDHRDGSPVIKNGTLGKTQKLLLMHDNVVPNDFVWLELSCE